MQLEHSFTVPVPVETAWQALLDPERVAPCFPGATLTGVTAEQFTGNVKVRMGPVSLLYKGTGHFASVDESAHRVVLEATGKDSRGNGTASATVTASLSPAAAGSGTGDGTEVHVLTDLTITGRPAQLGRGLIAEVGGKILDAFAGCLATHLGEPPEPRSEEPRSEEARSPEASAAPAASGVQAAQAAQVQPSAEAAPSPGVASGSPAGASPAAAASHAGPSVAGDMTGVLLTSPNGPPAAAPASQAPSTPPPAGAPAPAASPTPAPARTSTPAAPGAAGAPAASSATGPAPAPLSRPRPVSSAEEIDLLHLAGRPVLKRLLPVLAAVLALVVAVRWMRRRR